MIKLRFSHFYSLCLLHRVAIYFLFNKFHLFFWLRSNNNNNNNPLSHPHSTHMKGKFYNQKLFITQDLLQPQGMAIVWARERELFFISKSWEYIFSITQAIRMEIATHFWQEVPRTVFFSHKFPHICLRNDDDVLQYHPMKFSFHVTSFLFPRASGNFNFKMCRGFDFLLFLTFFCSSSKHSRTYFNQALRSMTRTQRKISRFMCDKKEKRQHPNEIMPSGRKRKSFSMLFPSIRIKLTRLSIFSPFFLSRSLSFCFSFDYCFAASPPIQTNPFHLLGARHDNNEWKRMILVLFFAPFKDSFFNFFISKPFSAYYCTTSLSRLCSVYQCKIPSDSNVFLMYKSIRFRENF